MVTDRHALRSQVLFGRGATVPVARELLAYNANPFHHGAEITRLLPEPHLVAWERYSAEGAQGGATGVFDSLKKRLVQWHFPIQAGISRSPAYRAAVQRGVFPPAGPGLILTQPEQLRLLIEPTPAGPVPVIVAANRPDFVALLQSLTRQNEPDPIPETMGGCLVSGYVNWDRIHTLRQEWAAGRSYPASDYEWAAEFQMHIRPFPSLYQDTFIVLSEGEYSGVPAGEMGLSAAEWRRASFNIRLAHECTHYALRRLFGSARNHPFDELLADYAGLRQAFGRFEAGRFLRLLGLVEGEWLPDGRLHHYRGQPPLSEAAFEVLQALLCAAAHNLEAIDQALAGPLQAAGAPWRLITLLTRFTLEELSDPAVVPLVCRQFQQEESRFPAG